MGARLQPIRRRVTIFFSVLTNISLWCSFIMLSHTVEVRVFVSPDRSRSTWTLLQSCRGRAHSQCRWAVQFSTDTYAKPWTRDCRHIVVKVHLQPLFALHRSAAGPEAVCQNPSLRHDTASWGGLPVLRPGSGGDEEGHRADEEPWGRWASARSPERGWTGGRGALYGVTR